MRARPNHPAAKPAAFLAAAVLAVAVLGAAVPDTRAAAEITRQRLSFQGAEEPHTPTALNRVDAYRYTTDLNHAHPDTVLAMLPGLNSGPNTLDLLARGLITRMPNMEVWIAEPRAGILQDRRGITEALATGDPDFALGYYYGGLAIDGQKFKALDPKTVPSAGYWGLDLHLRDVRIVIDQVHKRYPHARVLLGGHSLGAMLAALYIGYDFGRVPGAAAAPHVGGTVLLSANTGARDIDGLILIDGVPIPIPLLHKLSPEKYLGGFSLPVVGKVPGVNALLAADPKKRADPFTDTSSLARTQDSILFDVMAAYALLRPNDASRLPFYPRDGLAITNEALLAAVLSDQMEPDVFVRASIGSPLGVFKTMDDPAGIARLGLLDLKGGRPAPGHALIRWIPYDRSTPRGLVDIRALEAAILRPDGDFTQWYMPWRLLLDLGLSLDLDTSDAFSRRYVSLTQMRYADVPILILGAGRGLIRSAKTAGFYLRHIATPRSRVRIEIIPEYTHLDIENAVDNKAVGDIADWLPGVPQRPEAAGTHP